MPGVPSCQTDGRVLVLGDSLTTFVQMLPILARAGFHVATATAADLCKTTATLASFDLGLLLCSGRESHDGLLLKRLVRAQFRCIVVLHGIGNGRERAAWLERGADDCIGFTVAPVAN